MSGARTLRQTERDVADKVGDLDLDVDALTAVSNLYRAASAVRNHFEQSVLKDVGLTWTAFVVLWVVWIWEEPEARTVADEVGINKGTLTGVVQKLEARGLVQRVVPEADRRRVLFSLSPAGKELMVELFPRFNSEERFVLTGLSDKQVKQLGTTLRTMLTHLESS